MQVPQIGIRELRFLIVGGGAALGLFLLSWALLAAGMQPFAGMVLAYGVCFACAYWLQRNWTFKVSHSHTRSLPRYLMTQLVCAGISGLVAYAATQWCGFGPSVAAMSGTVIGSATSYVLSSRWAFA